MFLLSQHGKLTPDRPRAGFTSLITRSRLPERRVPNTETVTCNRIGSLSSIDAELINYIAVRLVVIFLWSDEHTRTHTHAHVVYKGVQAF